MAKVKSLRTTLARVTLLVAALAVIVAGALVVLTALFHRATATMGAAVESVRIAEEAEINLLLHGRASDALVKREIESELQRLTSEARRFVTTEGEAELVGNAEAAVRHYVVVSRDPDESPNELVRRQQQAYSALERLVAINVAQSDDARADAERWNLLGNLVGIAAGALVIMVAGGLLIWLRRRAFSPVFALADTMDRFGRGAREARAEERGPAELQEMSRRFNEMASAIAAQRKAQMAFLAGVAHDLRNPLSTLQLSVALVPKDQPLPPEQHLRQAIERIRRQITLMNRMVGDLLDVAKIEAGELELRLEIRDVRSLVQDVIALFEGTPSQRRLEVRVPDEAVEVVCDELRVQQVLTNLISNALKYSPAEAPIEVVLEQRMDEVILRVSDHGSGIAEADISRVFEPFRRVGLSKDAVPGAGLGLFVVRRIVDAHGGRIALDSKLGQGSTFEVVLPSAHRRPRESAARPNLAEPTNSGRVGDPAPFQR